MRTCIVGHGVVSTGAQTPALFGFQSPGDYATFNSNHTPDGTAQSSNPSQCRYDSRMAPTDVPPVGSLPKPSIMDNSYVLSK
jgi:hypothetical protein